MTQKEKSLIVLKVLFQKREGGLFKKGENGGETVSRNYVVEKIDACMDLARPEILLDEEGKKMYEITVEKLRKEGKII